MESGVSYLHFREHARAFRWRYRDDLTLFHLLESRDPFSFCHCPISWVLGFSLGTRVSFIPKHILKQSKQKQRSNLIIWEKKDMLPLSQLWSFRNLCVNMKPSFHLIVEIKYKSVLWCLCTFRSLLRCFSPDPLLPRALRLSSSASKRRSTKPPAESSRKGRSWSVAEINVN